MVRKSDIIQYCVGKCDLVETCIKEVPELCPKTSEAIKKEFGIVISPEVKRATRYLCPKCHPFLHHIKNGICDRCGKKPEYLLEDCWQIPLHAKYEEAVLIKDTYISEYDKKEHTRETLICRWCASHLHKQQEVHVAHDCKAVFYDKYGKECGQCGCYSLEHGKREDNKF